MKRRRYLLAGLAVAFGIALLPFVVGTIGQLIGNQFLANHFWYAYFSVPAGVAILAVVALYGIISWLANR